MRKRKSQQPRRVPKSKSSPEDTRVEHEAPKVADFTEIGGSPVPGLTLRHVLRGHTGIINRIAWSPDGSYLASPSDDQTIRIWDVRSGACDRILKGHTADVYSVTWSPDSKMLASASKDATMRLWDTGTSKELRKFIADNDQFYCVAFSPNGTVLVDADINEIRFRDLVSDAVNEVPYKKKKGFDNTLISLAWSPTAQVLAIGSGGPSQLSGKRIYLLDQLGALIQSLDTNQESVYGLDWSPDGHLLVAGIRNGSINIWNTKNWQLINTLEGHTNGVDSIQFSSSGNFLASRSHDGTVRIWLCKNWSTVAILKEQTSVYWMHDVAFHPHLPVLATLGQKDTIIRIWELDEAILLGQAQESVHYTTAKLVLVGDSGVGKTGLGWRLAHDEFKEHASTHGQQFWPIQKLGLKRKDGTECEAVLWDLAGQPVYRQIHSIFLENVAAALVLFDPSNRQEPLKGVQFWLEQLKGKGQLPPAVLIGARVDRGAPAISQQELDQFCQRYGIRGGYISTSAFSGQGLDALLETLKAQIPWDQMTATVTTVTFKRIKDHVLRLKERPDRKGVLVSPRALRKQLKATDKAWRFTDAEMMTAVGHLETHGYVTVLRSSAGEQHILLTPELLVTLASSIVLLADKHPRELGAVSETELLQGKFQFEELVGLSLTESQILLDAAILRFLEHNICFRETLNDETLLIFPGLIKQKRPLQDDVPSTDDISYVVRGRVENLYASLVVLLGYTPSFTRINQWQNQAQYEMDEGQICGFRLIEDREGEIEVVLYYGDRLPPHGRTQFQELFEQFLYQRDVEVTRFPPVVCPKGHRQERATIIKRVREGKRFVHCEECGARTDLPSLDQPQTIGIGASAWLQLEEAAARLRSAYEVQLTKVKGYRRTWAAPRCYVSSMDEESERAKELIKDLRDAGVYVVEQAAQVESDDFVIVLDTPAYQKAFKSGASVLAADIPLIKARLRKRGLISLALTGQAKPHEFEACTPGSFCDETHYPVSLFDLVLNLYAIPLTHAGFAPLRETLHMQWEQTLAQKKGDDDTSPLKIFISYSHKDETFKDELVTMLAGLQRRGIVDAWQDRRIEAGDEWYKSIQDAMDECDLALLLVSADYLASRFIQEEEQPKLLQRRQEMQLRVIPIIVRPCTWQSEPVLKDLQALPKDGKPVITFSIDTGARDQVWTDIATVIEKRATQKP
jgi:small GTP-binding protein